MKTSIRTAIVGKLKGQFYVFASWDTDDLLNPQNMKKVSSHIERVSANHTKIPLLHYITTKKPLSQGDVFSIWQWDDVVASSEDHINRYFTDWQEVNYLDLIQSAKKAKLELGL